MRVATRREKRREATMQEVMTVANDIKNLFRGTVAAEDILRAYESGEEVSVLGIASSIVLTIVPDSGCIYG